MKFERRIFVKILIAFLLAWTLFVLFMYHNMYAHLMGVFHQQREHNRSQLITLIQDTGLSLLTMSGNISDLVFSEEDKKTNSNAYLLARLSQAWEIFGEQYPLLAMGYYDKSRTLQGSWGITSGRSEIYATPAGLLRAFEERVGISYFSCQDVCYYHASRAFYPNSFEYGILHLSIPVDRILSQFASLSAQNITLLQKTSGADTEPLVMLGNQYLLQSSTRLLEFRLIQPFLSDIQETNKPYLFANKKGGTSLLYVFSFPEAPDMLYVLSSDVSTPLDELKRTFVWIMLGSFSLLCLMLGILHFSLHQMISRLNRLIKVLPMIGEGRFIEAGGELKHLARDHHNERSLDELGLLHETTISLNQQLHHLHCDSQKQNVQLRELAEHDAMTGLYNRRKFQELLKELHLAGQPFFLVNFDLDHFKLVNDTLGHAAGDRLLVMFAGILKQYGNDAILGRMGGDEFAMALAGSSREEIGIRMGAINRAMKEQVLDERITAFFSCVPSIGLAHCPHDTDNLNELAAFADAAMYENKRRKQGVCVFYSGQELIVAEEKQLAKWVGLILYSIQHDQLQPFFQPIMTASQHEVVAFEVLARMHGQQNGINLADSFISYAEQAQAVVQVDYIMLDRALRKAIKISPPPCLMINISNITLEREGTGAYIIGKLREYEYAPSKVVFELTESNEVKDFVSLQCLMMELRKAGIRFSLDDFGVGYSSFHYINNLKFDFIKLDKSIIHGLMQKSIQGQVDSLHILEAIVHIARMSNITTIAEGIESDELLRTVEGLQIDLLQGFLLGRPRADFTANPPPPVRSPLGEALSRGLPA